MNETLCAAIEGRRVARLDYNGGTRTVEPFAHGVTEAGNEVLRAFQTGGHSVSGQPVGWKLFRVDAVENLAVTEARFAGDARPDYNPADPVLATVHCRV